MITSFPLKIYNTLNLLTLLQDNESIKDKHVIKGYFWWLIKQYCHQHGQRLLFLLLTHLFFLGFHRHSLQQRAAPLNNADLNIVICINFQLNFWTHLSPKKMQQTPFSSLLQTSFSTSSNSSVYSSVPGARVFNLSRCGYHRYITKLYVGTCFCRLCTIGAVS